jgi:hypothetical protein
VGPARCPLPSALRTLSSDSSQRADSGPSSSQIMNYVPWQFVSMTRDEPLGRTPLIDNAYGRTQCPLSCIEIAKCLTRCSCQSDSRLADVYSIAVTERPTHAARSKHEGYDFGPRATREARPSRQRSASSSHAAVSGVQQRAQLLRATSGTDARDRQLTRTVRIS